MSDIQIPFVAIDGGFLLSALGALMATVFVAILFSLWLGRK